MQASPTPTSKTKVIDGIICHALDQSALSNPDYPPEGLEKLAAAESQHFWFKTRRQLICNTFEARLPRRSRVLEVGAGTGFVARGLQDAGYDVVVGEYYLSGLRFARAKGIEECHQMDIFSPPFTGDFDAIGLFDVIEHFEHDTQALKNCMHMLKPGGYLFATVPAHNWLWNRGDRIAGHKRRYNKTTLISITISAGFEVIEARYFFLCILPLLALRAVIAPDHDGPATATERALDIRINPTINSILERIINWENRSLKLLPNIAGGSLLLVARKPE